MTGPRDMKHWEARLYTQYRNNLHTRKPVTRKGRDIHRLERALIIWPIHMWMRIQQQREYKAKTTLKAPEGVFFNAEKED